MSIIIDFSSTFFHFRHFIFHLHLLQKKQRSKPIKFHAILKGSWGESRNRKTALRCTKIPKLHQQMCLTQLHHSIRKTTLFFSWPYYHALWRVLMTAMYSWKTNNWRIFMEQTLLCCYKTKCTGARENIANLVNEKTMMFTNSTQQTTQMLLKVCFSWFSFLGEIRQDSNFAKNTWTSAQNSHLCGRNSTESANIMKNANHTAFKTAKPHIRIQKNSAQTAAKITRNRVTVELLRPLEKCNLRNRFNRL